MSIEHNDYVLPRPVGVLPEYAHAKARQTLAERLADAFGLSGPAALAIANAVVDPSEVRKSIGEPDDPDVERIAVPGGTLLGIRTSVWARRCMPDPRNPRTLPSRRHPFAIDPGTGGDDSKFRPVPEPRMLDRERPQVGELAVDVENRDHLTWATQQAAQFVLAENDWRKSIESQGVMEAVWLVATTYVHNDGSASATTLTTAEGSSRTTAVHNILDIRSSDVPYDDNDAKLRGHIRKLNEQFAQGDEDPKTIVALRCERIPALILVGFVPHPGGATGFPTAVKSFVALRHVDPPKPWGDGPENESLADEVLDELYRRDLISKTQREYYAGSCTRSEARAARLPDDPALRAVQIVDMFVNDDPRFVEAIRVAVTSQSTRKRMTSKLLNDLATALILRAVADDPSKVDQIRRYMRFAFGKSVHRAPWEATGRSTAVLTKAAVDEVRAAIGSGDTDEPGPATMELAVRAAYPLVVSQRLSASRGSTSGLPDRRTPGEVLDAMRRSEHGVMQLGRALEDFSANEELRAIDETGAIRLRQDGEELQLSDVYLRNEFPPPGKAKAASSGDTPIDRYNAAVASLSAAMDALEVSFTALCGVTGDDTAPIVEGRGVEPRLTEAWRKTLGKIDEELVIWARAYRKAFGTRPTPAANDADEDDAPEHTVEDEWEDDGLNEVER
ncbi:MAG: hypothetical protein QM759_12425 [Terricaulis sp.]